jgi:2-keto-3-deoxy-L-rhamnonate aldolase RhmA
MRSTFKSVARAIAAVGLGALAVAAIGSPASAQVWTTNTVKQKMLAGQPIVARRIHVADPAVYCRMASAAGTDFVWTDMVHSGMEFGYVSAMWAAVCPGATAKMRAAEIFFQKEVDFVTKAYYKAPDPRANAMHPKEMQRATDSGAMVVMINVDNVEQARQVVQRAYYPTSGLRDLGIGQFEALYPEAAAAGGYVRSYNDNLTVIAIISSVEGVSQASAIAAVAGIHALSIDTMNLESDAGYRRGSPDYNKLELAIRAAAVVNQKYLCVTDRSTSPNTLNCAKAT